VIPYEVIVTSASRPHLLKPTLESLLVHVDQPPQRVLIHNDAAFDAGKLLAVHRWMQTKAMLGEVPLPCETLLHHADPPRRLGMALAWLIGNVTTDYVLYSQDDFVTVRDLPIRRALQVMDEAQCHQIRFNKRATMGQKDTWRGPWKKVEQVCSLESGATETVTISDHWYFQTGLWRTSVIRAALWWLTQPERVHLFAESPAEEAINKLFDGEFGPIPGLTVPHRHLADVPRNRAQVQRTFIWGPIGEDRYVRHIGTHPDDWAGGHAREAQERDLAHTRRALDEIATYQPMTPEERQRLLRGRSTEPAGEV
jgi:hypothetical protein